MAEFKRRAYRLSSAPVFDVCSFSSKPSTNRVLWAAEYTSTLRKYSMVEKIEKCRGTSPLFSFWGCMCGSANVCVRDRSFLAKIFL